MYGQYVEALAKHAKVVFEEMAGTEVLTCRVNEGEVRSSNASLAHVIEYENLEKKIKGEFVLGFASDAMALSVAADLARKMGLAPIRNMDDVAVDLLNEFLNTIVGRTISEWDVHGLPVRFSPPRGVPASQLKDADSTGVKNFELVLNLAFSQVVLWLTFLNGEKQRVMVVDDSAVMRNFVAKILERNYEVAQAGSGPEAIELFKQFQPNLVLMDMVMPEMDGLTAIAAMREADAGARFIMLTSSARKDQVLAARKLKVTAYLIKPVNGECLSRQVEKVLA